MCPPPSIFRKPFFSFYIFFFFLIYYITFFYYTIFSYYTIIVLIYYKLYNIIYYYTLYTRARMCVRARILKNFSLKYVIVCFSRFFEK